MIHSGRTDHGKAIAAAIPRQYNPAIDPVISRTDEAGNLLGGVIYDGFTGSCIFAHQAGFTKHWLSRDMLWMLFDYPFNQLQCKKLCGTIPSSNPTLLAINLKFGFNIEASIKDAYPDGDMLILSMTRDECRWLNVKPRTLRAGS